MGNIRGICISEVRGVRKKEISEADIELNWGIVNDAHGGRWHRQISLLSYEKVEEFKQAGAEVSFGAFGENLIIEGFDFRSIPVGTRFRVGEAVIEMTQIGKECHSHCAIYHQMGDCIMPREGVFAEVIRSGHIKVGDEVEMIETDGPKPLTAAVVTLSDKGYAKERKDESGPLVTSYLEEKGYQVIEELLLPDEQNKIEQQLIRLADQRQVHLIITTGGTGFSIRDCTPEATLNVCERRADGIAEAIRYYSMTKTKRAMLSRGAAGIRGLTLIVNLPGSPRAVAEIMEYITDELKHGIEILRGSANECGR